MKKKIISLFATIIIVAMIIFVVQDRFNAEKIIKTIDWDVRILGEEYRDKEFTGRDQTLDKCYFNKRPHNFSSSELRERVSREHFKK